MRYRKKPIVIEAMQFTGSNSDAIVQWAQGGWKDDGIWTKQKLIDSDSMKALYFLVIQTLEGDMEAAAGDWIIRGVEGEVYPCKNSVFKATYEAVE